MIYLPVEDVADYACYVVQSGEVIRAYKENPEDNKTIEYTDFYINSHYLENYGTQTFDEIIDIPTCIDVTRITNAYSYRNDFVDIMVIFTCLVGITVFLISTLIKTLLKGRKLY